MSIQALREQRAAKAKELHDLVNNKDEAWTDDKQAAYDAGMKEIDALDAKIKRINDLNERVASDALTNGIIEAADRIANDQKSDGARVFAKWLRVGDQGLNDQDRAVIQNTMSTTTNTEGGYTVATEVAGSVLDALKDFGGMREVATVIRTAQGNAMNFPTSDGTAETGEIVGENVLAADLDISFGVKALPVYKYSSKTVAVPIELLQDSSVDVEGFVRSRLVTRLGRITNTHFTVGTGTGQPNGAVTGAAAGKVGATGQTVTVTYDDLVDLEHSVDPAYRKNRQSCGFMMADTSVKVIRKIKDTQGRPIFVPGYEVADRGGAPDTLLNRPIFVNQDCPVMAANAKSILFGDFSFYTIRDALDISMFRFTDSAYARKGQVGFLAFLRSGGNLIDVGGALKYYQNSAT